MEIFIARSARRQGLESETRIAELKLEAETLRRENVRLETELLDVKQRLGPRFVTEEQKRQFALRLSRFEGTPVDILAYTASLTEKQRNEPIAFGNELADALGRANLAIKTWWALSEWPIVGIWIRIPERASQEVRMTASSIHSAIEQDGGFDAHSPIPMILPAPAVFSDKCGPQHRGVSTRSEFADIRIIIGLKPAVML